MERVKIKMEYEFWYYPETNTYETISSKSVETEKKPTKVKNDGSTEPLITLEDNKIVLNSKAVELLNVVYDDRLTIKYQKVNGDLVPVIAKDEVFGTKGGNKITKSNTVSCRGKANEKLAEYGDTFKLVKKDDSIEIYIMQGNKEPAKYTEVDENIQVTEPEDEQEDLEALDLGEGLDSSDATQIDFKDIL